MFYKFSFNSRCTPSTDAERDLAAVNIVEDGLYRRSGELAEVQRLRGLVEKAPKTFSLSKESNVDVHAVTGLLKLYLREMPGAHSPCSGFSC